MVRSPNASTIVCFGDIAEQITDRVDDPRAAGVDRYVGLEHLDPESLRITRWGTPDEVSAQKLRFRPGDIIFGKRRAYQRKVAVADFDGICSAHAMVLRERQGMIAPGFLAHFMASDTFMARAVQISVGSLSPTINWSTLRDQQFILPPLEEQRRVLASLKAIDVLCQRLNDAGKKGQLLLTAMIDSFMPSQDAEDAKIHVGTCVRRLDEVTTRIVDGVHKKPAYTTDGIPFLTVENLTRGPGIDMRETRFVSRSDHVEFSKRAPVEKGDVLVSKDGTLGVARVVDFDCECSVFVSVALLKPRKDMIDSHYLRLFFESSAFKRRLASKTSGSALKHIHLVDFRQTTMPVPALANQKQIVERVQHLEKGLLSLKQRKTSAERVRYEIFRAIGSVGASQ
jgi:type I restriction enzyme S subunit